jgi:hypothetical protein
VITMASIAQVLANVANAQFSTGPKSEEGKQKSSFNACKHGLNSRRAVIPGEDPVEFARCRQGVYATFQPQGELEEMLAEELVSIQWRLRRIETFESDIFSADKPDLRMLQILSLHAARLRRGFTASLKDLNTLQATRQAEVLAIVAEELEPAMLVREADLAAGRTTDFDPIGFVLKLDFVDEQIRRKDAIRTAAATLNSPQHPRRAA